MPNWVLLLSDITLTICCPFVVWAIYKEWKNPD